MDAVLEVIFLKNCIQLVLVLIINADCGGTAYSAGGWESIQRFDYGTFTFRARASNVAGN